MQAYFSTFCFCAILALSWALAALAAVLGGMMRCFNNLTTDLKCWRQSDQKYSSRRRLGLLSSLTRAGVVQVLFRCRLLRNSDINKRTAYLNPFLHFRFERAQASSQILQPTFNLYLENPSSSSCRGNRYDGIVRSRKRLK